MAKGKRKYWIAAVLVLFVLYIFFAAGPIPVETILSPSRLSSLESGYSGVMENRDGETAFLPFTLGDRFGYMDGEGRFSINRNKKGNISLSKDYWAEYESRPGVIEIRTPTNELKLSIENPRAYPLFLDDRIFLVGEEQNSLSALDDSGAPLWTYDFSAPLTCIDAAAGLVLAGSLDGVIELLDQSGKRVFLFEPGGSRFSVILGCTISRDGTMLGIVSGIDDQRFLLLERFGEEGNIEYKVIYHEFLEDGFRRPVHVSFTGDDQQIIYECQGGLGIYALTAGSSRKIPLEGTIAAVDLTGNGGLLFIITSLSVRQKRLVAVELPGTVILEAPFKSENVFLGRAGKHLYVGGGTTLASFELEQR
jgi:hypothetical protein